MQVFSFPIANSIITQFIAQHSNDAHHGTFENCCIQTLQHFVVGNANQESMIKLVEVNESLVILPNILNFICRTFFRKKSKFVMLYPSPSCHKYKEKYLLWMHLMNKEMHLEIFEIFLEMVIDLNNYTSISIKLLNDNEYAHVFDKVQCTFQKNFGIIWLF